MDPKGKAGQPESVYQMQIIDDVLKQEEKRDYFQREKWEREVHLGEKGWINLGEKIEDIDTQPYKYQYN